MRYTHASAGFPAIAPIPVPHDPESLAEAARKALAREQRAGTQPALGAAGSRSGLDTNGSGAGRRSGARSGRGRSGGTGRSQQPNGCRALRRRGG